MADVLPVAGGNLYVSMDRIKAIEKLPCHYPDEPIKLQDASGQSLDTS
jgi:hypothetical protein